MEGNLDEEGYQLFVWSYKFHNEVNKRMGKPTIPFSEAVLKYGLGVSVSRENVVINGESSDSDSSVISQTSTS